MSNAPVVSRKKGRIDSDETQGRIERMFAMIGMGVPEITAATSAGVPIRTVHEWRKKGIAARKRRDAGEQLSEKETMHLSFFDRLRQARATAEARCVTTVINASQVTWQAAAWWLERRLPHKYALRNRVELSGRNGGAIHTKGTVTLDELTSAMATAMRNESAVDEPPAIDTAPPVDRTH